jgi:prolyl-tRNA editing enzyme YbaK/EbsC (Cys-tRNA(Pro) deacylase)
LTRKKEKHWQNDFSPEIAKKNKVGGTSPFATRRDMPVFIEQSILSLPRICINGGKRGYLIGIEPQVCVQLLNAKPVHCALIE